MAKTTKPTEKKPADNAEAKFPVEKLSANCRQLFGVSGTVFAGATAGLKGNYTVSQMANHINKWLKKEVS